MTSNLSSYLSSLPKMVYFYCHVLYTKELVSSFKSKFTYQVSKMELNGLTKSRNNTLQILDTSQINKKNNFQLSKIFIGILCFVPYYILKLIFKQEKF